VPVPANTLHRWATISPSQRFRYVLGRRWAEGPTLLFVMLNPSTADAEKDDATIRRCMGFAQAEGYGALEVVNLFAYRATKPRDLKLAGWPVGPDNDQHIRTAAAGAAAACLAWGAHIGEHARPQAVLPLLREVGVPLKCLKLTAQGHPSHPLMLASSCRLVDFTQAIEEVFR